MIRLTGLRRRPSARRPRWRSIAAAAILFLVVLSTPGGATGGSDVEIRLKAAYIYNFARFVEWPAHSSPGPVRIGVVGNGVMASALEQAVRGKTANGRPIEIAHISAITDSDCCEILLIERSESKHMKEITQAVAGRPVLTVCDGENGLRDGVMIAFQIVDESVRFQINQEAVERAGMKISSQLLKVALPAGEHFR